MSDAEALALCITAMKNVTYCFNSEVEECYSCREEGITSKHPSCNDLLRNTIDKVEGK